MQLVQEQKMNTHAEHQVIKNHCYMVDETGREVPITTTMVQDLCIELLRQCRTVQN